MGNDFELKNIYKRIEGGAIGVHNSLDKSKIVLFLENKLDRGGGKGEADRRMEGVEKLFFQPIEFEFEMHAGEGTV